MIVLTIVGILSIQGVSSWHQWRRAQSIRVLQHDIARALAFARNEAFLRGETLELTPLSPTHNWAEGIMLDHIQTWEWHIPMSIKLTWHGFRGNDRLVVSHLSESLAMNGYFLLEVPAKTPEKWVVNRFGRLRIPGKQVA